MRTRTVLTLLALAAAVGASGCKSAKSSSPLSPSVAGPIPGVAITAPKTLEPSGGQAIEAGKQPVTLVVENAASSGQRPLNYLFEVALDEGFSNKVFTREGITPGDGRTSFKLPEALASDRSYYWRARAQDGANTGPYSSGAVFSIYTPIVLDRPGLIEPVGDVRLPDRSATLVVSNAGHSGPVSAIVYEYQVALDENFSRIALTVEKQEQTSRTSKGIEGLSYDTRYFWRARAWEMGKNMAGPWSSAASFRTGLAPVVAPPPPTAPPVGTGGPVKCGGRYPSTGPDVVECVAAAYSSYLRPVGSVGERLANMDFLRDRIIETGICGGMDLAWNAKRGDYSNLSHDFVVERSGGADYGHDIAVDYDNYSTPLRLYWGGGTMPFYATYSPRPSCK